MTVSPASSSSSSVIENLLSASSLAQTQQTAAPTVSNAPAAANSLSSGSTDTLTTDIIALLKALVSGDPKGAKIDLAKLEADLKVQEDTDGSGAHPSKDVTTLLKDLFSSQTSAATTDVTRLHSDLNAGFSTSSRKQPASPLVTLVSQIPDSLSSGSTQGALQDLAAYLVQNGQSTGALINTSA